MAQPWSVTKPQLVRPFPEIEDALKGLVFRLGPDRPFEARDSYEAREVNVVSLQPEFQFSLTSELKKNKGLALVVSLQDTSLHRSEVVFESKLEEAPETYQVPVEVVRRFGWKGGVRAVVSIIQAKDSKRQDGSAWLRGHWVAKRIITVGAKPKARAFPIESWKAEKFKELKLPEGTVYWLDFTTRNLNQKFKKPEDMFRLGIREDVYDALAANQESVGTKAAFAMIVTETVTDLVVTGLQELAGEELEKGGVMETLIRRLHRSTGITLEILEKMHTQEDGRSRIRAHVQTMQETSQPLLRLRRSG